MLLKEVESADKPIQFGLTQLVADNKNREYGSGIERLSTAITLKRALLFHPVHILHLIRTPAIFALQ